MAPFSMMRRSPRSRKGSEQQKDEDDVKIENGTPAQEDDQRSSNPVMVGSKNTVDGESKGRRVFNKELLHNIRSRLTGKTLSSTPQRGTASQVGVRLQVPLPPLPVSSPPDPPGQARVTTASSPTVPAPIVRPVPGNLQTTTQTPIETFNGFTPPIVSLRKLTMQ
ncbi:uncharacterized protein B0H64DRAFT_71073 [Chaetomium fimeti]|uniref:Uncharacterized protein n=1 Tax=Chaetomium fimeti TaxID=1854472 RepID=A0AAE0HL71_9PEZI|nr:hypothetical protein B0H64DRAFT_71073 [Chaetomium fimeti]